jgi:lipid II:glycine glycyltransferase (peptidoglycan interpeptide bridge formation enzyme)
MHEYRVANKEEVLALQEKFKSNFLQTTYWAEFKNWDTHYLIFEGSSGVYGYCVLLIDKKYFFKLAYVPRGPILNDYSKFKDAISSIEDFSKKQHVSLLKIEPDHIDTDINYSDIFKKYIKVNDFIQPIQTAMLDVGDRDSMIKNIPSKYRGRIRNKFNLELRTIEDISEFFKVYSDTANMKHFKQRNVEYFKNMKIYFKDHVRIFAVYYNNTLIAASFNILWQDTLTYLYSGSDKKYNNMYPGYFLVFESSLSMKDNGIKVTDLWGVSDDNTKWQGFSEFKKNIGGKVTDFPGSFDLPLNKLYYFLYKFVRK